MATLAVYGDANDNSEEGTTEMDAEHDPRETFRQALDQAGAAVAGMKPEQLGDRTPCSEFDVATLANHLIGAVLRAGSIARGVPVTGMLAVSGFCFSCRHTSRPSMPLIQMSSRKRSGSCF